MTSVFATSNSSAGYFDVSAESQYLGLSNMNKEFRITSLMNSAIINDYKAAEIFINTGANVNDKNIASVTALHLASRNEAHETAQILLRHGAIVDPRDNEQWTPLMRASLAGDFEMIKILMGYGAGAWNQNEFGDTPIVHATMADCYECVKYILENAGDYPYSSLLTLQLRKALDIANKRYNEPLIKLLKDMLDNINKKYGKTGFGDSDNLNPDGDGRYKNSDSKYDIDETRTIVELLYVFMGRTISAKDIEEMGRKAYINSQKSNHDRKAINRSDINCSINSKNCKRILIKDETIYKLSKSVDSADNNKTVDNKEVIFLKKDNTKDSNIKIQDNKVITDKKVYNLKPTKNNIYNLKKTNNDTLNKDTIIVIE